MTTYYVTVGEQRFELGETDLFSIAEQAPGSAFAYDASAATDGRGTVEIPVAPSERKLVAEAIGRHRAQHPTRVYDDRLAEIQDALRRAP